jgi:hypothetical protein
VTKRSDGSESFANNKILKEKPMFKTISTMTLLGLLTLSAAHAQSNQPIRAKVPFAFAVQNTMMAAGNYELNYNSNSGILTVRGLDQNSSVLHFTAQPASDVRQGLGSAKLVFGCYSENCFLTRVWQGADLGGRGLMLAPSPRERKLAFTTRAVSITIPGK